MTDHDRIWLEPAGAGVDDRCWCQDNQWGEEGVEYVRADLVRALLSDLKDWSQFQPAGTQQFHRGVEWMREEMIRRLTALIAKDAQQ